MCAFSFYLSYDENDKPTFAEQVGEDPNYGPFATALRGADSVVAVVTGDEECDIKKRLWCLFELHLAKGFCKKVTLV